MTTTSTDPREIEADLERDRASLGATLDALSDRVSVEGLASQALGAFKSRAGGYTDSVDSAVRSNPLAVAVIGAGVAWLLIGNRLGGGAPKETPATGHPVYDELPRWESEGGPPPEYGAVAYRPTTSRADPGADDDDDSWSDTVAHLRRRASAALHRIESEAKSYYRSAVGSAAGGAGQARDYASERASVVSGFASDLKERLAHGLDGLPEPARERIVAARERAYAASLKAERMGRQAVTDPSRMMEEHPLVAGAVAFALGAAVAAALPRTDVEDRAFGSERDRLMDEAAQVFRSERERAMQIAGSVTDELKVAARDTLDSVTERAGAIGEEIKTAARDTLETATDRAGEVASRVTDRAAEEADASRPATGSTTTGPVIG